MNNNNNITKTRTVTASFHSLPSSTVVALFVVSVDISDVGLLLCEVSSVKENKSIEQYSSYIDDSM